MTTSKLKKVESYSQKWSRLKYRESRKHENTWRNSKYLREYGIDLEQYNTMLENQNFVCKICNCPETVISNKNNQLKRLAVDHCHETGIVRGLLCDRCNHILGLAKDSIILLNSAQKYLENIS